MFIEFGYIYKIRNTLFVVILSLLILVTLSSCANHKVVYYINNTDLEEKEIKLQREIIINEMANASRLLHKIGWLILKENTNNCSKSKKDAFGFIFAHVNDLPDNSKKYFYAANKNWDKLRKNYDPNFPIIISIAPNSPTSLAGFKEGDRIVSINEEYSSKNIRQAITKASNSKNDITMSVLRGDQEYKRKITGQEICSFNIQPLAAGAPNAFADGKKIYITIAAIKLAESDDEIAFLIGHELAHNILHFSGKGLAEAQTLPISYQDKPSIRSVNDIFVLQSTRKETEADIEGIKYAHKAGYNLKKASDYWRRLSIFNPNMVSDDHSLIYKGNAFRASTIDAIIKDLNYNNNNVLE